jgi:hypothetical protein
MSCPFVVRVIGALPLSDPSLSDLHPVNNGKNNIGAIPRDKKSGSVHRCGLFSPTVRYGHATTAIHQPINQSSQPTINQESNSDRLFGSA